MFEVGDLVKCIRGVGTRRQLIIVEGRCYIISAVSSETIYDGITRTNSLTVSVCDAVTLWPVPLVLGTSYLATRFVKI